MLKFFRKIRQKMIKDNNVTKYILYAIGEIILVVFGILIALNINNRNETSKLKQKEFVLLIKMQQNLNQDLGKLNRILKSNNERNRCYWN
ncbi:DUF6090 family protein [Seonamhaeicola maritimus]|uniref:S-adenosyl-methyltransferase n=1 Tax=Seonamhaeicola maritimus TaxID=2591822 RepID=A0A5C7GG45_9FLAO|nr:DUF6090 family protein [Seonamhaeicola maritimus]TXG35775.1 hypothetical protein FUA22_14870 [Seonamhaeicola maritimus]